MPSIVDILLRYNVPYVDANHKHGRPGWVQVDCPDCGLHTGKYHLGISLSTGAAACWRCGKKNTAKAIATLTGRPRQAIRELLDGAQLEAPVVRKTGHLVLPGGRGPLLAGHRHYLAGRGLDADSVALTWGVEGIGNYPRLAWRLFIPVHHHGEIVSWTTRTVREQDPQRYVSAAAEEEAVPHKSILYGADYATHTIIIHEGPVDVWATGPGAVATCGTAYTDAQVKAMVQYAVRVVCFDAEADTQARARALAAELSLYPGMTYNVELETGKDTAEADPREVAALRKEFLENC